MKYTKSAILLAHKNGVLPRLRKQMILAEVHKKYDLDDEIAILRQSSIKPDERAEHDAYVEDCKHRVDEYINSIIASK